VSHVVRVRLPDGRIAEADYREPVVKAMRRVLAARSNGRDGTAADYAPIAAWLDRTAPLWGVQMELYGAREGAP